MHGGAAQLTQLLDQQLLDFIGGLERPVGRVRQIEDALHPDQHLRLLPKLLNQPDLLRGELKVAAVLFHPDSIGASG